MIQFKEFRDCGDIKAIDYLNSFLRRNKHIKVIDFRFNTLVSNLL